MTPESKLDSGVLSCGLEDGGRRYESERTAARLGDVSARASARRASRSRALLSRRRAAPEIRAAGRIGGCASPCPFARAEPPAELASPWADCVPAPRARRRGRIHPAKRLREAGLS